MQYMWPKKVTLYCKKCFGKNETHYQPSRVFSLVCETQHVGLFILHYYGFYQIHRHKFTGVWNIIMEAESHRPSLQKHDERIVKM